MEMGQPYHKKHPGEGDETGEGDGEGDGDGMVKSGQVARATVMNGDEWRGQRAVSAVRKSE